MELIPWLIFIKIFLLKNNCDKNMRMKMMIMIAVM